MKKFVINFEKNWLGHYNLILNQFWWVLENFLQTAFLRKLYHNYLGKNFEKIVKRCWDDFEETARNCQENIQKMSCRLRKTLCNSYGKILIKA